MSSSTWFGRHGGKDQLRQRIWSMLTAHQAVCRNPVGHIPNFIGAEAAAERLAGTECWHKAQVVKCNPDSPHRPVRLRALADGKVLYMAVPELAHQRCFVELTAATLGQQEVPLAEAASMAGEMRYGRPVTFAEMSIVDLVVVGCVAVTPRGGRTGKGAGFADLELAMLRECGLISEVTPIVTTVHDLQVVPASELPMQRHDWPLDMVVTPTRCLVTEPSYAKPVGLDWATLQPDQLANIPILQQWNQRRQLPF